MRRTLPLLATLVLALVLALLASLLPDPASARAEPAGGSAVTDRTNIVVVVIDDLAKLGDDRLWSRLPNIRSLFLDSGLRFTNYSGNDPLCCPGRANLLTGQRTDHHGVWRNDARLLRDDETIATELRAKGYHTIISGKYFNGTQALSDRRPAGWTHADIFSGGYYGYTAFRDGTPHAEGWKPADYSTDVFGARALSWLREAPPSRPVLLWYSPFAVHQGWNEFHVHGWHDGVPAPRHRGDPRCADVPDFRTPATGEADVSDKPLYIGSLPRHAAGWPLVEDCEALLAVDEWVGRIRDELVRQGRLERTLFLLTVDNGMSFGRHRWRTKMVPYATPLDLFIRWPEAVGTRPGTVDAFVQNIDIAPTLCAVAGCRMGPYASGRRRADGISVLSTILSRGAIVPSRRSLVENHLTDLSGPDAARRPAWRALRTTDQHPLGLWHLVLYADGERELYDLRADPEELDNLAGRCAVAGIEDELERELRAQVRITWRETSATRRELRRAARGAGLPSATRVCRDARPGATEPAPGPVSG